MLHQKVHNKKVQRNQKIKNKNKYNSVKALEK
jgi:hypothetical protein